MSNELLFEQQQQLNANSQLEINQVQVGGQELGEEGKEGKEEEELVVETLQELDHEIECPKCNDVMVLSADFDSLCYL